MTAWRGKIPKLEGTKLNAQLYLNHPNFWSLQEWVGNLVRRTFQEWFMKFHFPSHDGENPFEGQSEPQVSGSWSTPNNELRGRWFLLCSNHKSHVCVWFYFMQEKDIACQVEEVLRDCFCSSENTSNARADLCLHCMLVCNEDFYYFFCCRDNQKSRNWSFSLQACLWNSC